MGDKLSGAGGLRKPHKGYTASMSVNIMDILAAVIRSARDIRRYTVIVQHLLSTNNQQTNLKACRESAHSVSTMPASLALPHQVAPRTNLDCLCGHFIVNCFKGIFQRSRSLVKVCTEWEYFWGNGKFSNVLGYA